MHRKANMCTPNGVINVTTISFFVTKSFPNLLLNLENGECQKYSTMELAN